MARMKHPKGDLQMTLDGLEVHGSTMCIKGKMGVWSAQIEFEPEDVGLMFRYAFKWQMVLYILLLPWRLIKKAKK